MLAYREIFPGLAWKLRKIIDGFSVKVATEKRR